MKRPEAAGNINPDLDQRPARRPSPLTWVSSSVAPLPHPLTPVIGREQEIDQLHDLLIQPAPRLITITGPGGIGKTRLALETGDRVTAHFLDGVVWVPMVSVSRPALVLPAIAQALGIREAGEHSLLQALQSTLREARILLILDNFEHILEAAPVVADLLAASPRIRALVTSRALLRISGERAFPLSTLALPEVDYVPQVDRTRLPASMQLFVDRARAVAPSFELTDANLPDVAAICRRLDGLPLALELAAARTNLMPPAALLGRLDRRLPLLTGGSRDQPERLRTMRAAIAWSFDFLSIDEQIVFRRLGVFAGGAALDAAEIICSAAGGVEDPLAAISSLVDWSLLQIVEEPAGHPRIVMLETVREYSLELLGASNDEPETRAAHAQFFASLVERHNIWKELAHQARSLTLLETDHANIRSALTWFWEKRPIEAEAFCRMFDEASAFWWARGHIQEGLEWSDRALTLSVSMQVRAGALRGASYFRLARGELDLAESLARESINCAEATGNHFVHAFALFALGYRQSHATDQTEAIRSLEQGLEVARLLPEPYPFQVGILMQCVANLLYERREIDHAESLTREALAILEPSGEQYGRGYVLRLLGWILYRRGKLNDAVETWMNSLRLAQEIDDPAQVADSFAALARAANDAQHLPLAARLLGVAESQRDRSGNFLEYYREFEQTTALITRQLEQSAFEHERRNGRTATSTQIESDIELLRTSLSQIESIREGIPAAASSIARLTPREVQILRLVVAGKTDREISDDLFVSVRTIEHHVSRIFGKLGVRTRTAAATTALSTGIIVPESRRPV